MGKQLTAMNELLKEFKTANKSGWFSFDEVEQLILDFGIPKEKNQIINAVDYGMAESVRERYSDKKLTLKCKGDAEQYYNNNFKQ